VEERLKQEAIVVEKITQAIRSEILDFYSFILLYFEYQKK
jgi:hypothetical protein